MATHTTHCAKYRSITQTDLRDWNPTWKGKLSCSRYLAYTFALPPIYRDTKQKKKTKAHAGVVRKGSRGSFCPQILHNSLPRSSTRWCIPDRAITWRSKQQPSNVNLCDWACMHVSSLLTQFFSEGIRCFKTSKPVRKWNKINKLKSDIRFIRSCHNTQNLLTSPDLLE